MKIPLLLVGLLAFAGSVAAQSKFAGEYLGVASPAKWRCDERFVVDVFVNLDGTVDVFAYDFDLDLDAGVWAPASIDSSGRFATVLSGFLVKAKVSASGTVRGTAVSADCKYTFTALRRYRYAYDPDIDLTGLR